MALIKCSECQKEVSDKAINCPNCGNPIVSGGVVKIETVSDRPIKIEPSMTSKNWKGVKLLSGIVIVFGFIFPAFFPDPADDRRLFGWVIIFVGIIGFIIGKIGAWYADKTTR